MKSMTGHGRGSATSGGVRAIVECASVNRKGFELVFVAPRDCAGMEPLVREVVAGLVQRGRLTVSLSVEAAAAAALTIDDNCAKARLAELVRVQKSLGLEGPISLETVLAGPGVMRESAVSADIWPCVKQALAEAMGALDSMRAREGRNLHRALKVELRALAAMEKSVGPLAARAAKAHREVLAQRIARAGGDPLEPRIAAEIVLLAERSDITEELARLASHRSQFAEKLEAGGAIGRTLEFLAQELGREWNTIGSKSSDAAIARFVVEAKAVIDKLREQLANVE